MRIISLKSPDRNIERPCWFSFSLVTSMEIIYLLLFFLFNCLSLGSFVLLDGVIQLPEPLTGKMWKLEDFESYPALLVISYLSCKFLIKLSYPAYFFVDGNLLILIMFVFVLCKAEII